MEISILDTIKNWEEENILQVVVTKVIMSMMMHIMEENSILIAYWINQSWEWRAYAGFIYLPRFKISK
jgi:hypothetical protein